jgi:O-antigen ligase
VLLNLERYKAWTLRLARASSLLFFYGIIASMAAANIGMALTLLFWLLSGAWFHRFSAARQSPIFLPIVALLLVTVVSLSYTVAPLAYANRYLLVYGKLLFILVLLTLHDDPKWLKALFFTMALAVAVVLTSTYANVFLDVPWANSPGGFGADNSVFYDYIAQGIMSVCASVVAWVLAFRSENKPLRQAAAAVFLLLAFSVMFLLASRTGQLAMPVALLVVSALLFSQRHFLVFLVMAAATVMAALVLSPVLLSKISLIVQESSAYMQQGVELTSVGARLSMWVNSLHFIADAPLFGHGVGGYRYLSEKVYLDPVMCAVSCVHPHNQLLFFMVEYGLVGFVLFGLFIRAFVRVARDWRGSNTSAYAIVVGLSVVFLVDSFINSPLWISSLRNFYIGVFALIFIHHATVRRAA